MFKRFFNILIASLLVMAVLWCDAWAIKYKGDLEANESITFPEQGSTPANPAATKHKLYFKDDGAAYTLDSSGNENPVARAGLKNYIMCGNFRPVCWQRGTSFVIVASLQYTADRWKATTDTGTATLSRQAFTLGQTDVPGEPQYYFRHDRTVTGTGLSAVAEQRIESVRALAGQKATISFWAKAEASKTLNVRFRQVFGTGGSPSATVSTSDQSVALTTSWQKFSLTFAIPSITGKTLGTNDNDYLQFWLVETGSFGTFTADLAQVQLEEGSVATVFERRPVGLEFALAQRYYQKTFRPNTAPAQNTSVDGALMYRAVNSGASNHNLMWYLKTQMRAPGTVTFYNPSALNTNWRNFDDSTDSGAPTADVINERFIGVRNPQATGDTIGERLFIHTTVDSEL